MKIKFLTPELHEELKTMQTDYPALTFHNVGYQYIDREVREAHKEQIDRISEILKEHVIGFVKFYNFKDYDDGRIVLRFDYNWGEEDNTLRFVGVGYVTLDQLLNGFPEGATQC
jgi:hypothetical protein